MFGQSSQQTFLEDVKPLFGHLKNVILFPAYARAPFCLDSSFSSLNLKLALFLVDQEDDVTRSYGFPMSHIVKPPELLDFSTKQQTTLRTIVNANEKKWPTHQCTTEIEIFTVVTKDILCMVADSLSLEEKYRKNFKQSDKISFGSNGMGDSVIWHGHSDAFMNAGVPVSPWNGAKLEDEDVFPHDYESTVCVEAKKDIMERERADPHLSQLVGSAVINAFIEANTKDYTHPIPSVIINGDFYRLCFYDSRKDLLLISNVLSLSSEGRLLPSALLVLWIIANHR